MKPARGFAQILIVVIVTILIGVGAVFGYFRFFYKSTTPFDQVIVVGKPSPQPLTETANWKDVTFNGLTFKIPPAYFSGYLGSGSVLAIDPQSIPQTPSYGDFTPAFSLELIKNKTLDQSRQEFLSQQGYVNKQISDISINNKAGLKMAAILPRGQDTVDHHILKLYLSVGQDLYQFSSIDLHITSADQQKYFSQIISTFKFTN